MTYQELMAALELFQIDERSTLKQIKTRHRELVKSHHPDHSCNSDPEMIRTINTAYEVLRAYCEDYVYCFTEDEFLEQVPEERLRRQFGWDPVWGGQDEPEKD